MAKKSKSLVSDVAKARALPASAVVGQYVQPLTKEAHNTGRAPPTRSTLQCPCRKLSRIAVVPAKIQTTASATAMIRSRVENRCLDPLRCRTWGLSPDAL